MGIDLSSLKQAKLYNLNDFSTQSKIDALSDAIDSGEFHFGDPSDKPAVAIKTFKTVYGRNPTPTELTKYSGLADINGAIAGDKQIADQAATQRQSIEDFATKQSTDNSARRAELANLLTNQADKVFSQDSLPAIAEDSNAKGIYTGTGFSEALAREKARLGRDVTSQLAQTGLGDINTENTLRLGALTGYNDLQNAGLQRDFSLQDYSNQANLSREIGKYATPTSSKGGGGGALAGGAGGAAAGTAVLPGWGTAIGAVAGALYGGLSKRQGGK